MNGFFRYKYTIGFFVSVLAAVALFWGGTFDALAESFGSFGYVSALLAGFLFSITFFAAPAALYLVALGEELNPWAIVIFGAIGAMLADLVMYRFLKDGVMSELKLLMRSIVPPTSRARLEHITKSRVFAWLVPFFASVLIASPFPDEIGLALFGLVNFRPKYLSVIAFGLNAVGIFVLVFIGYSIGRE